MAEWKLVTGAMGLGRDVSVDAAEVTAIVLERVRAARVERGRWVKRATVMGSLAVAALLLLVMVPRMGQVNPVAPAELRLAELDDAAPAELEMVLVEFAEPAVPASSLDGPDVEGLDMSQVERALRSWEES